MEAHCMYAYEDSIMKPTKHCLKHGGMKRGELEYNGGGKLVQSIPYVCMELLQCNLLVLLMYNK
jgi:hypothetical protein